MHFIGADRYDLACLRDVEQGGVIALEATRVGFGASAAGPITRREGPQRDR